MSNISAISAALVKAQKQFAPALTTATNPHFRSKYADLSACVEAVVDALNDNGIYLLQRTSECDSGIIIETVFMHESGELIECGKLHIPAVKQDAQGFGSAMTYARRYSLMAACGIAPEDDDGNAATKGHSQKAKSVKSDFSEEIAGLRACSSMGALQKAWAMLDKPTQQVIESVKNECKAKIEAADKLNNEDIPQ